MRVVLINARDAAGDESPVNQRKPGYYGLCVYVNGHLLLLLEGLVRLTFTAFAAWD